jgi:hypothetical protein
MKQDALPIGDVSPYAIIKKLLDSLSCGAAFCMWGLNRKRGIAITQTESTSIFHPLQALILTTERFV